jgi:hypothetical protein
MAAAAARLLLYSLNLVMTHLMFKGMDIGLRHWRTDVFSRMATAIAADLGECTLICSYKRI